MCFAFAIFHALFEVRSLLRDPIPAFEQLETAEGYIKTLDQAKSSFRIVVVITPRGNIGVITRGGLAHSNQKTGPVSSRGRRQKFGTLMNVLFSYSSVIILIAAANTAIAFRLTMKPNKLPSEHLSSISSYFL